MKIILAPTVHLLSEPKFHPHPEYPLPDFSCAAEGLVAHAGKGCYDSYGKDGRPIEEHIKSLIESRHGSVLEHANFSLFLTGISRGLSHELVRHRAGFAFSQRSTRYTAEGDAAVVLSPYLAMLKEKGAENLSETEMELVDNFLNGCIQSFARYQKCVEQLMYLNPEKLSGKDLRKWARGQARQLLPHALETRMTITGNIRAWRYFFEQRSSRWAEDEIRRLAGYIWYTLFPVLGCTIADYRVGNERGIIELTTDNVKV